MDSKQFDEFVRRALGEASRRGVVRAGIGAFAASALATLGLSAVDDAEAKKKKKKKEEEEEKDEHSLAGGVSGGDEAVRDAMHSHHELLRHVRLHRHGPL